MRGVSFRANGWRAQVAIFGVVALVALGALTATTWMGIMVGDLAYRLGAARGAADVAEGVASSIATAGIIAGMVLLGRWSRGAAPGAIDDNNTEES